MKKVITAIGNQDLNNQLKLLDNIEIKSKDIFYKEGILEFLEKGEEIDIVVLNQELCMDNLMSFLKEVIKYEVEIYLLLKEEIYEEDLENISNIKIFNDKEQIIDNFQEKDYFIKPINNSKKNRRVISVLGSYGVGKTVFCSFLGKYLAKNNKVLIINFDIYSNDLKFIFDIKNQAKSYKLEDLIFKASKNIYILNGLKYIFNETNKIDTYKVKELIEELKKNFDYIIIDTSSEIKLKYIKTIFPNCDYNIFLVEPNILQIKKSKELLEVYFLDFNLDSNKTGILVNKYNMNSTDLDIIKNIFENCKLLGKINYELKMNSYINTFTKNNIKIDVLKNIKFILKGEKIDDRFCTKFSRK